MLYYSIINTNCVTIKIAVDNYQANDGIPVLVPGGDVEEVGLVVVEQQLDDHPSLVTVILP